MINEQKQRTRQKCKERNRKKEKRIRETNLWKKIDKHMKKEKRSKNNVQMHFEASDYPNKIDKKQKKQCTYGYLVDIFAFNVNVHV